MSKVNAKISINKNSTINNDIIKEMRILSNIHMRYLPGVNNTETGRIRQRTTLQIVARFGLTCPSILAWLYDISYRAAVEHLSKLVKRGLLQQVKTFRASDGVVYVCTYSGAKFAEDIIGMSVYFRRPQQGREVNVNSVMHDLMNSYFLLRLLQEESRKNPGYYTFSGLVTERESKRLLQGTNERIVDGFVIQYGGNNVEDNLIVACEIENSFKNKAQRSDILLRYLCGLKAGMYNQVFMFSQSYDIIKDIKRLHSQLLIDLVEVRSKKTGKSLITEQDAKLLSASIIYRTKYCDELTNMFYL